MPECVVPGCAREGRNNLSIRLRRPDTSAIWAPNTEAFVRDTHAESGARLTLYYQATDADRIEVIVHGIGEPASRITPIHHREEEPQMAEDLRDRVTE